MSVYQRVCWNLPMLRDALLHCCFTVAFQGPCSQWLRSTPCQKGLWVGCQNLTCACVRTCPLIFNIWNPYWNLMAAGAFINPITLTSRVVTQIFFFAPWHLFSLAMTRKVHTWRPSTCKYFTFRKLCASSESSVRGLSLKPSILLMCYTRTLGRRLWRGPQEDATGVQRPSKSKPGTSAPLMAPLISSTSCDAKPRLPKESPRKRSLTFQTAPENNMSQSHKHPYFVTL